MKGTDQTRADDYAAWFRCLSDGTRVRLLTLVAIADEPITVGEIVEAVGRSQSTVTAHLKRLSAEGFVFTESDGVRTLVRVNETCMTALPEAAAVIMNSDLA